MFQSINIAQNTDAAAMTGGQRATICSTTSCFIRTKTSGNN